MLKKSIDKNTKILITSSAISILLLITFFILQYYQCSILTLENKWIILSIIPIIIGLFLSGTIKSIKGFGIELEANLSKKIDFNSINKLEKTIKPKQGKESLREIEQLSNNEKSKIKILQFIECKNNYYNTDIIIRYFEILENIQ